MTSPYDDHSLSTNNINRPQIMKIYKLNKNSTITQTQNNTNSDQQFLTIQNLNIKKLEKDFEKEKEDKRNEIENKYKSLKKGLEDKYYNNSTKSKQTKLEKYGDSTYNNTEKNKQTCIEKYGVTHTSKLPYIIEKINENC